MKKTRLFVLLSLAMFGLAAQAQIKLVVNPAANGFAQESFLLSDVNKLTFDEGLLSLDFTNGQASKGYSLKDVMSIKFINEANSVEDAVADGLATLGLSYADGFLTAKNGVNGVAAAAVYDLAGKVLVNEPAWEGDAIDVTSLTKGVYIFKVNNEILKFQK